MGANLTVGNTNYTTNDREGLVMKLDQNFSVIWSNNVTTQHGNEISDVDWGSNNSIAIVGDCNATRAGISFGALISYKRCDTFYSSNTNNNYAAYGVNHVCWQIKFNWGLAMGQKNWRVLQNKWLYRQHLE